MEPDILDDDTQRKSGTINLIRRSGSKRGSLQYLLIALCVLSLRCQAAYNVQADSAIAINENGNHLTKELSNLQRLFSHLRPRVKTTISQFKKDTAPKITNPPESDSRKDLDFSNRRNLIHSGRPELVPRRPEILLKPAVNPSELPSVKITEQVITTNSKTPEHSGDQTDDTEYSPPPTSQRGDDEDLGSPILEIEDTDEQVEAEPVEPVIDTVDVIVEDVPEPMEPETVASPTAEVLENEVDQITVNAESAKLETFDPIPSIQPVKTDTTSVVQIIETTKPETEKPQTSKLVIHPEVVMPDLIEPTEQVIVRESPKAIMPVAMRTNVPQQLHSPKVKTTTLSNVVVRNTTLDDEVTFHADYEDYMAANYPEVDRSKSPTFDDSQPDLPIVSGTDNSPEVPVSTEVAETDDNSEAIEAIEDDDEILNPDHSLDKLQIRFNEIDDTASEDITADYFAGDKIVEQPNLGTDPRLSVDSEVESDAVAEKESVDSEDVLKKESVTSEPAVVTELEILVGSDEIIVEEAEPPKGEPVIPPVIVPTTDIPLPTEEVVPTSLSITAEVNEEIINVDEIDVVETVDKAPDSSIDEKSDTLESSDEYPAYPDDRESDIASTKQDLLVVVFVSLALGTLLIGAMLYGCYRLRKKDEGSYTIGAKA